MKKIIVSIYLAGALFFSGCDSGLEIVDSRIDRYPNRIVYFANRDVDIDLSGGIITIQTKEGTSYTYDMDDEEKVIAEHSIDFSKPGVYQVELTGQLSFPIQVVDTDYINTFLQ